MANMCLCLWLILQCVIQTSLAGSAISIHVSPTPVLAGLTSTMTLRCALNKTTATSSIIGRRDVTISADNMAEMTSIIVMKNGKDVASVSHSRPAHVMDGSVNVQVAGNVAGSVDGYLELTFEDPTQQQKGEFTCEINAVSESGHIVTFTASQEVVMTTPTTADLVTYVRQLNKEKNELDRKYNDLKAKVDTKVFFSAGSTRNQVASSTSTVMVFDRVFSNIGGAYNNITGVFVCGIAGYYEFEFNLLSVAEQTHFAHLQLNNQNIVASYGRAGSGNQHEGSNTAIIKVHQGDEVRIVLESRSSVTSGLNIYTTFSGNLVALL